MMSFFLAVLLGFISGYFLASGPLIILTILGGLIIVYFFFHPGQETEILITRFIQLVVAVFLATMWLTAIVVRGTEFNPTLKAIRDFLFR